MQGGMKKSRLSTNISQYLRNDTRHGHGYYGMRIGNLTQAFEWYHFQWPWTTPNPDLKVTPLFDTEYLNTNVGILIGTYVCSTQVCHFEWFPVTLSELAKYSVTRSIARPLRDSWASCIRIDPIHFLHVYSSSGKSESALSDWCTGQRR